MYIYIYIYILLILLHETYGLKLENPKNLFNTSKYFLSIETSPTSEKNVYHNS